MLTQAFAVTEMPDGDPTIAAPGDGLDDPATEFGTVFQYDMIA